jgi:hypothetical protein
MLGSVFPVSVQRGKTTEVTVYAAGNGGANLYGAYKALFEGTGIQAEVIPPEKGWPARDPMKPYEIPGVDQVKLKLTVAPDAPLGVREFRLGTPRHGISTVGQIVISDEPQMSETEPNNTLAQANPVTLPVVVSGRLQQGEDEDCFRFQVEAGQGVTFAALCARLQDKIHDLQEHADPMLILRDSAGKELARSDDYFRADPLLHYKFEKAGEYILVIRDVRYSGNPQWVYALTMTAGPFVTATVPCAVRPGQSNELQVTGFNLGQTKSVRLDVPADLPVGIHSLPLPVAGGLSNPVALLVTDAPQTATMIPSVASAGNKTVTAALNSPAPADLTAALPLPGGANGVLTAPGQIHRYRFQAKKGAAWNFEVTARRLNSELDSEIKIRNAKGDKLAENDDGVGKDSRLDWTAPEDGEYIIEVRDLTGQGGPTFFYNLTARPIRPDFALKCDTDRALIAPGNRTCWFVLVERRYGFAGPVTVEVKGLPAGVTASALTIPPELGQGVVFLTAAPDAKIDTAQVEVFGTATLPGEDGQPRSVTKRARPLTEIYIPGGGRGLVEAQTQGVSITEPNDVEAVEVSATQVSLAPNNTVKIEVTIKRREGYTKPVTLDVRVQHLGSVYANPLPPGVVFDEGASKTLLNENETKGHIVLKANADAKPIKDWPIAILAHVSVNFVMKVWYVSPPILLTVTPPMEAPPAQK